MTNYSASTTETAAKKTITKRFDSAAEAEAYWQKSGNGLGVVENEMHYLRDGGFEVITVTSKARRASDRRRQAKA